MEPVNEQNQVAGSAELTDELAMLRMEIRVLREVIDEFRDELIHSIRNLQPSSDSTWRRSS